MTPPPIAFAKVRGPYGWLSNMSPHPITVAVGGGVPITYRTCEHLFQCLRETQPRQQLCLGDLIVPTQAHTEEGGDR